MSYITGYVSVSVYDKNNNFIKNIKEGCLFEDRYITMEKLINKIEAEGFKTTFGCFYME